MTRTIEAEYFDWMYELVCGGRLVNGVSFKKLLQYLHDVEFIYSIEFDDNRADDGINLRRRFVYECDYRPNADLYIHGPCSVLEMMIALSIRCEEIMDNPDIGDRTGQWFWRMVVNLGLGDMSDDRFDLYLVEKTINRFLNREYEYDGTGGLFVIRNCDCDLRDIEIWEQMCYFLDTIY